MGMFDGYRLKKSLAVVCSARIASSPEAARAIARIKSIGQATIPKLVESMSRSQNPDIIIDILSSFLDNKTLSDFATYLSRSDSRVVEGILKTLTKSTTYDPNRLIPLLADPKLPRGDLGQILLHHKERLHLKSLLAFLDNVDKESRGLLLRLIEHLATEATIPDLTLYVRHEDPTIRFSMVRILARFHSEAVRDTLLQSLTDSHKRVRQTALEGLADLQLPVAVEPICQLLRDPETTIQSKAKEVLIKIHDPQTPIYLVDLLQDEDDTIRRYAAEVLNAVGNTRSIKLLLEALKSKEWQVKARTFATIGAVGGQRLLEHVLPLLKDGDGFVRGSTIEIIHLTGDQRAFHDLVEALEDQDLSVRTRAAEALAKLGDSRAIPAFLRLLEQEPPTRAIAIRALITLNDRQAIRPLLTQLVHPEPVIVQSIVRAMGTLTDGEHAAEVWQALMTLRETADPETKALANATANAIVSRFGDKVVGGRKDTRSMVLSSQPSLVMAMDHGQATPIALPSEPPSLNAIVSESNGTTATAEGVIDATALEPDTLLEHRYRVINRVGQGGFGTVILVEDTMVGEEIILKFLNPQVALDENMIKRFIHELRYARRISHENVIRIYDFLTLGKSYAISMEYFPSHSLADELRDGIPINTRRGLKIVWDICRGIGSAHQLGIVHRDLKPPNILINDSNLVKVVDFGLAAVTNAESRLTRTGVLLGTPTYMAPEQVRNRTIDARTDIYSLGVIMYEMFTGHPPYVADDPMSILFQHVEGKPAPPRQTQPDISPMLESIILKAMEVSPAKRFQSMDELRKSIVALSKQGRDSRH